MGFRTVPFDVYLFQGWDSTSLKFPLETVKHIRKYIVVSTIRSTKENIHAHTQEKTQLVAISSSVVKLPYYGKAATPLLAATQKGVALLQNTLQIY